MKPSLGQIVLVPVHPTFNNGKSVAPAIITGVNSDTSVNVRIYTDSSDNPPWRTSLTLVDEIPEYVPGESLAHVWAWPPRV